MLADILDDPEREQSLADLTRRLGIPTVAVHSADDAASLHVRQADEARALPGTGPAAYLDMAQVVEAACTSGCDAVHPGYGFLAENGDFARRCAQAGLTFVGPAPGTLDLFGDKVAARAVARRCGVPVLPGTDGPAVDALYAKGADWLKGKKL